MNFDEISLVIPCLEMAYEYGYTNLQAPQPSSLRAFKTHFGRQQCPWVPHAKYIYVCRDPVEAATSFYHFMEGWCFPQGAISVRLWLEFARLSSTCLMLCCHHPDACKH